MMPQTTTSVTPTPKPHPNLNPKTADKTIPVEDGRQFAAVLPGHHLVEVEGADHNFTGNPDHLQHLITAVLDFLQQHKDFSLPSPQPADSSSLASS